MKRKRSDDDAESTALALLDTTRSDLWFEDGSIVVRAEKTVFRVYKGTLSASSAVWKKMVANLHPEALLIDECPVLSLDDTAQDVECVFETLFYRDAYSDNQPIPIEAVFPPTVERWINNEGWKTIAQSPDSLAIVSLHAAALTRELDLLFLLPAAFHALSDPSRIH
ncbi:hypothetical protein C8F01DRAFT_1349992 [Mycena amicta]|nr:hypothetical protein C8F01DRAFT_1349992 [Mycena amicta]